MNQRKFIKRFTIYSGALCLTTVSGLSSSFYTLKAGTVKNHIDLHPVSSCNNYIDFDYLPLPIPSGTLLPESMENIIPANKNTGTSHITCGRYRLHPVEFNIGESSGIMIAFAPRKRVIPYAEREKKKLRDDFQNPVRSQDVETHWLKN